MAQPVKWYVTSDQEVRIEGLRRALPVSALTQTSGTATLTSEAHGITTGDVIYIEGAEQDGDDEYLGAHTGTSTSANTITFTVDDDTESPATGDIEASVYLADATVTATITPDVGAGTISFDYKTGSYGLYVGNVPDTATFAAGTTYTMTITCTASTGEKLTITLSGPAKTYPDTGA